VGAFIEYLVVENWFSGLLDLFARHMMILPSRLRASFVHAEEHFSWTLTAQQWLKNTNPQQAFLNAMHDSPRQENDLQLQSTPDDCPFHSDLFPCYWSQFFLDKVQPFLNI